MMLRINQMKSRIQSWISNSIKETLRRDHRVSIAEIEAKAWTKKQTNKQKYLTRRNPQLGEVYIREIHQLNQQRDKSI